MTSTAETSPWVTLAVLLRPQGRKGELLADLLTDFPERFRERGDLHLRSLKGALQPAQVEDFWLPVGRNAGRIVLKLQGTDTIEAAQTLAGFKIVTTSDARTPLDTAEDEQYIADLIDCAVFDREQAIGTVEDVQFPTNATGTRLEDVAPLLVVRSPTGEELLIPYAKDWLDRLDLEQKSIHMRLPPGLLDINTLPPPETP